MKEITRNQHKSPAYCPPSRPPWHRQWFSLCTCTVQVQHRKDKLITEHCASIHQFDGCNNARWPSPPPTMLPSMTTSPLSSSSRLFLDHRPILAFLPLRFINILETLALITVTKMNLTLILFLLYHGITHSPHHFSMPVMCFSASCDHNFHLIYRRR